MKKIISFVLCTALLFAFFPFKTAYAYSASADAFSKDDTSDSGESTSQEHTIWQMRLSDLCYYLKKPDLIFPYDGSGVNLYDYTIPYERAEELNLHSEMIYAMSDDEAHAEFDAIIEALTNVKIRLSFFNDLYEICMSEENDNSYYPKELWERFTDARSVAEKIYKDESDGAYGDKFSAQEIEKAFKNLEGAFYELCEANKSYKDVDKDGIVTLKDVTLLQRYIAELTKLNTSQVIVASMDKLGEINMSVITNMQRYLAKLEDLHEGKVLGEVKSGRSAKAVLDWNYCVLTVDVEQVLEGIGYGDYMDNKE